MTYLLCGYCRMKARSNAKYIWKSNPNRNKYSLYIYLASSILSGYFHVKARSDAKYIRKDKPQITNYPHKCVEGVAQNQLLTQRDALKMTRGRPNHD